MAGLLCKAGGWRARLGRAAEVLFRASLARPWLNRSSHRPRAGRAAGAGRPHPRDGARPGGRDIVAECVLRSGAELSAKVRKGEPELVEEAGTRSAGLRVIQGKRVASTSTSDLTDRGHRALRGRRHRAGRPLAGGPLRGARRSEAPLRSRQGARPRPVRPRGRRHRRGARHRDGQRGRGRGVRVRPAHHQQRGRHLRAHRRRRGDRPVERLPRRRQGLVPVAQRRPRRGRRGRQEPPRLPLDRAAPPRRARSAGRGRARGGASHAAQARRAHRTHVRGAGRLRSRRRALHPRHARGLRHGQLHLAQVELPRGTRGHARRERSR